EDGIRDYKVTGVQTCALPISPRPWVEPTCRARGRSWVYPHACGCRRGAARRGGRVPARPPAPWPAHARSLTRSPSKPDGRKMSKIGRASCRERGEDEVVWVGV